MIGWILGIIASISALIGAWLHGKKVGTEKQVAKENAAIVGAHIQLDRIEQATEAKIDAIEEKEKTAIAQVQTELKEKMARPVDDSDFERIQRESKAAREIELSDQHSSR